MDHSLWERDIAIALQMPKSCHNTAQKTMQKGADTGPSTFEPNKIVPDNTVPPTLRFPAEDDHGAWHRYNRALHAIPTRHPAPP